MSTELLSLNMEFEMYGEYIFGHRLPGITRRAIYKRDYEVIEDLCKYVERVKKHLPMLTEEVFLSRDVMAIQILKHHFSTLSWTIVIGKFDRVDMGIAIELDYPVDNQMMLAMGLIGSGRSEEFQMLAENAPFHGHFTAVGLATAKLLGSRCFLGIPEFLGRVSANIIESIYAKCKN